MPASIRVRCSWLARHPQPAHGGFVSPMCSSFVLPFHSATCMLCRLWVSTTSSSGESRQDCPPNVYSQVHICWPYCCSNAYANQQTYIGHLASWLYLLTLSLRKCTNSQLLCVQEPDAVSFCRQGEAGDCHCRDGLKFRSFGCGASASDTAMLPLTQCRSAILSHHIRTSDTVLFWKSSMTLYKAASGPLHVERYLKMPRRI